MRQLLLLLFLFPLLISACSSKPRASSSNHHSLCYDRSLASRKQTNKYACLKATRAPRNDLLVNAITNPNKETTRTIKAYPNITKLNIDSLFTHELTSSEENHPFMGAKAISYDHLDGHRSILFWPTGDGATGNGVHHRDALLSALKLEEARYAEQSNEELWIKVSGDIELFETYGRNHLAFSDDLLKRAMGFQLTLATSGKKEGKITQIDLDSSITSAQVSKNLGLTLKRITDEIAQIYFSIDEELIDLDSIRIRGLDNLLKDLNIEIQDLKKALEERLGIKSPPIYPHIRNSFYFQDITPWSFASLMSLEVPQSHQSDTSQYWSNEVRHRELRD